MLNRSPDADLKQTLRVLNDKWQPLLANTKSHQQNVEKVHKLIEELNGLEDDIANTLNTNSVEIEELKKVNF